MKTASTLPPRAEMLAALEARDASWDGLFYAAVTTTGVFCRPSCPARHPRPEHVEFHATAGEALRAGFRPCKRCRPLEERGRTPSWMTALIARVEAEPSQRIGDAQLRAEGLSPATVRRHFTRSFGLTFQAYSRARRLGGAVGALRAGDAIDDVVFAHGWTSHSGFREAVTRAVGAPPGKLAADPDADIIRLARIDTPLGGMVAAATGDAVCLLEFADRGRLEQHLAELLALSRDRSRPPSARSSTASAVSWTSTSPHPAARSTSLWTSEEARFSVWYGTDSAASRTGRRGPTQRWPARSGALTRPGPWAAPTAPTASPS